MNYKASIVTTFLFLYLGFYSNSQSLSSPDKKILKGLSKLNFESPKDVQGYFQKYRVADPIKVNWGFGWEFWFEGNHGDLSTILGFLYYFKDSLKYYTIYPDFPFDGGPDGIFVKEYQSIFSFKDSIALPYDYKIEELNKPLKEYHGGIATNKVSKEVSNYMGIKSGTLYSYSVKDTLYNRRLFNEIKNKLTFEELELLMYSINPASRLTAIEFYFRNREKYKQYDLKRIDDWIEKNFKELPMIEVSYNGKMKKTDTKQIVLYFASLDI